MSYSREFPPIASLVIIATSSSTLLPQTTSRYEGKGAQMIYDATTRAVDKLLSLPLGEKEKFTSGIAEVTIKIGARANEQVTSRQVLPLQLPDALP